MSYDTLSRHNRVSSTATARIDAVRCGRHNDGVTRRVGRTAAGLVVVPFLALASTLAPTHAHESCSPHSHTLIHSHFEPHEPGATHDHDGAEFEQGAGHVVWLDTAIYYALPYQLDPPPALVAAVFEPVPITNFWSITAVDDAAPLHGPPRRALSVRGPPYPPL